MLLTTITMLCLNMSRATTCNAIARRKSSLPYTVVPSPTPYNLPFSHNTAQLAYNSSLSPFKVIQCRFFLSHLKGRIIYHFLLVIYSSLNSIFQRFRDTASFTLNFLLPSFNPKFENVSLILNWCKFACLVLRHKANYSCNSFFSTT